MTRPGCENDPGDAGGGGAVMASCDAEMIVSLSQIGEDEIAKLALCKKATKKQEKGRKKKQQLAGPLLSGSGFFLFFWHRQPSDWPFSSHDCFTRRFL